MLKIVDLTGILVLSLVIIRVLLLASDPLWFASIVTVICFFAAVRTVVLYSCADRLWPAPGLMFLLLCMLTNHLGAFYSYYYPYYAPAEAAWMMIWAFNLGYLGFAAGTCIAAITGPGQIGRRIDRYYATPVTTPNSQHALVMPALIIFVLSVGGSVILMQGQLPILAVVKMIVSGRLLEASLVAIESRNLLHSVEGYRFQGYLNQVRIAILPMITLLWFINYRVSKRLIYKYLTVASLIITCFMLAALLERSGLFLFIIQLIIALMLIEKPRLSIRWLYGMAGLFGLLVALSILLGRNAKDTGFGETLLFQAQSTVRRIYVSNSLSSIKTFELFPEHLEYRWGQTWLTDLRNLLPGPGEGLSREIYTYMWEGSGNAVPHFMAEMWANGGFPVVFIVSLLTGIFMHWLAVRILKVRIRTPLSIVFTTLITFCFALLGFSGFMSPVNRGLLVFLILYFIFNRFITINSRISGSRVRDQQLVPSTISGGGND